MSPPDRFEGYIPLDRTFHELSKYAGENDEVDLSSVFHVGKRLNWRDLLAEPRVLILSEAGAGKTEEIKHAAEQLKADGKSAFFLRLEHIPDGFEGAFEVGTFEEFETWTGSNREAWLLLDSVDEARLGDPKDFERAIREVGRRVARVLDRVHIIITSRTVAWRPKTDLNFCSRQFPIPSLRKPKSVEHVAQPNDTIDEGGVSEVEGQTAQEPKETFRIVALDGLSTDQIRRFAVGKGVKDVKNLLDAIERADAETIAARPQDLSEIIDFWLENGRIGPRIELMRNSIERRLTEHDQERADARPLSPLKAREGARLLAAATTLCKDATLRIPDGASGTNGIKVDEVLFDWNDQERATLLSRPVFDGAIYGTVRFHHRSVREFLTAEWFANLLKTETSRRRIEALFFRRQFGMDVVCPTLRPILPWLALMDEKIRLRLLQVAPEVIFEGGDPTAFPYNVRKSVLQDACAQLQSESSGRTMADFSAVQRFTGDDLTDDIRSLLVQHANDEELSSFLLRMIWIGQLKKLLPEAKGFALNPALARYPRMAAFRAVKAIGSPDDVSEIRAAFLNESETLKRDWVVELVQGMEVTQDSVDWLLACLEKCEAKGRYSVDTLGSTITDFVRRADNNFLRILAQGLNRLLEIPPVVERRYCTISSRFSWLLEAAAVAVMMLTQKRDLEALQPFSLAIISKLTMTADYSEIDLKSIRSDFSEVVPKWLELNRTLFWYSVEQARQHIVVAKSERMTEYWLARNFYGIWSFVATDLDYIISQITEQTFIDNKLVALSLAFDLFRQEGSPAEIREKLQRAVSGAQELEARLESYFNPPPPSPEIQKWNRQEARWKREAEARKKEEAKKREEAKTYIADHIAELRAPRPSKPGSYLNMQWYLVHQMRGEESLTRWTHGNWRVLIPEHGYEVAKAFRDGVVPWWRTYQPVTRSEGAPPLSTPHAVVLGLTGIEIEAAEDELWPENLSQIDVETACRYASFELNGFPTWFPQLFDKFSETAGEFLLKEIRFEMHSATAAEDMNYVLSDIAYSGSWAWGFLGDKLASDLASGEPENLRTLEDILRIVQGSNVPDDLIADIAEAKVGTLQDISHLGCWYAVWTGVRPDEAISSLSTSLSSLSDEDAKQLAMAYLTRLVGSGRRSAPSVRHQFRSSESIQAIYLLMHRYIRISEDIDRGDTGVYSPELRDEAQDARNSLLDMLIKIPGKESFLALEAIAEQHPHRDSRPRFKFLAKSKAQQESDIEGWRASDVYDFDKAYEKSPTNHEELAKLAHLRFLDMKDDLENGDSSIAKILRAVDQETDMRKFLGKELREKAYGRYNIPQEEQLADDKRPDLRFQGNGFDGPVPVELKIADKDWTGPKLFERLRNQLCGDYLRDNRSSLGIFVLVNRGTGKKQWELPGSGEKVGFDRLIEELRQYWTDISDQFPGVEEIFVVGIDLSVRSK